MREILFRGKRVNNGEWIEGSLYHDPDLEQSQIYGFNYTYNNETGEERETFRHFVDCSTVGQYTGLTDKNGKKIFEGDILKLLGSKLYKVYFDKAEARFQMTGYDDEHAFHKCVSFCEIIGNMHDNPELLEGE